MLETILVFAFSLMPLMLWLLVMRKAEVQAREALRAAMEVTVVVRQRDRNQQPLDQHYIEGIGYLIGNINCKFNARSTYIRCAVNPQGPCEGCPHFQPREIVSESMAGKY